jgi:hypothetical protein
MARKGMPVADVPRVHEGGVGGNVSNAMNTPQGPKLLDFLPQGQGAPVRVLKKGEHDLAMQATSGSGRMDTGYDTHNMNQLRRDVHRPSANYKMPALPGETPVQAAGTAVASPAARRAPASGAGAIAHAPTQMSSLKPPAMGRMGALAQGADAAKPMAGALGKATSLNMQSLAGGAAKPMGGGLLKAVGQGAAKAMPALKPGGAMANMFGKALGKIAAAELLKVAQFYGPTVPFTDQLDRGASPTPRSRLDKITSREQIEGQPPKREDGRDFLAFENAPGTQLNEVAATQQPQERTASVNPELLRSMIKAPPQGMLQRLVKPVGELGTHKAELAGLGILTAPSIDTLQARTRSHLAGEGEAGTSRRQLMGEAGHALAELGGLGVLAGPSVSHLLHHAH